MSLWPAVQIALQSGRPITLQPTANPSFPIHDFTIQNDLEFQIANRFLGESAPLFQSIDAQFYWLQFELWQHRKCIVENMGSNPLSDQEKRCNFSAYQILMAKSELGVNTCLAENTILGKRIWIYGSSWRAVRSNPVAGDIRTGLPQTLRRFAVRRIIP